MMIVRLFFFATATTIAFSARIRRDLEKECTPGESWIKDKIKFECFDEGEINGIKPVVCVPEEGKEKNPGEEWDFGNFQYKCELSSNGMTLSLLVTGCLAPSGDPLPIGQSVTVPTKGIYTCVREQDGSVRRKRDGGCVVNGRIRHVKEKWYSGDSTVTCIHGEQGYQIQATACKAPNGDWVDVDAFIKIESQYLRCILSSGDASVGELVQASEADYLEWSAGGAEEDEISDSGSIGTGNANQKPKPSQNQEDTSGGTDETPNSAESPTTNNSNSPAESPTESSPPPIDNTDENPTGDETTNEGPEEPTDTTDTGTSPEDTTPADTPPADTTPADTPPADTPPEDTPETDVDPNESPENWDDTHPPDSQSDPNTLAESPTDSDPTPVDPEETTTQDEQEPTDQDQPELVPEEPNGNETQPEDSEPSSTQPQMNIENFNNDTMIEPIEESNSTIPEVPAESPTETDPTPPIESTSEPTEESDPGPTNGDPENPAEFPPSSDPPPVTQENTNSTDDCQDSHPSCTMLCNSLCEVSDSPSRDEPPVGLALRKKREATPVAPSQNSNGYGPVAYVSWREYNVGYYPGYGTYMPQGPPPPPGQPPQMNNGQCKEAAMDSHTLVKMLCPKACGVCGQKIDPPKFVQQFMSAGCKNTP